MVLSTVLVALTVPLELFNFPYCNVIELLKSRSYYKNIIV